MHQDKRTDILHRLIAIFFIVAVSGLYCGSTMFMHSHEVGDVTVWHSHPFAGAQHGSTAQILTIDQLNNVVVNEVTVSVFVSPLLSVWMLLSFRYITSRISTDKTFASLRAPPVLSLII